MGREIRRVAPDWEHPLDDKGRPRPLWRNYDRQLADYSEDPEVGPPDEAECMPRWAQDEATWWQMYENTTEGTPTSPAFPTAEELRDYLAANGEFGGGPLPRAAIDEVLADTGMKAEDAICEIVTLQRQADLDALNADFDRQKRQTARIRPKPPPQPPKLPRSTNPSGWHQCMHYGRSNRKRCVRAPHTTGRHRYK